MLLSRQFLAISLALCFGALNGQAPIPPHANINFHVPVDWKKAGATEFILRDFDRNSREAEKSMSQGYQPWRLDPANVAAACMMGFGAEGFADVFELADCLKVVKPKEEFALSIASRTLVVCLKYRKQVPIAYRVHVEQ